MGVQIGERLVEGGKPRERAYPVKGLRTISVTDGAGRDLSVIIDPRPAPGKPEVRVMHLEVRGGYIDHSKPEGAETLVFQGSGDGIKGIEALGPLTRRGWRGKIWEVSVRPVEEPPRRKAPIPA